MTASLQVPLQVTIRDIPRSDALEAEIRQRVDKLEEFHSRITSCRVTVEQVARHQHQGKEYRVRIDLRVPGEEIAVNRDHDEDVYVALRDAFDAARRRLEDAVREQRGDVKHHETPQVGKVGRLFADEGYGFIALPEGGEVYFSRENVAHPSFEDLRPGTEVQFIVELAAEGPQAKRVSVGKHHR
jgi:ribosomal subunit interface protein